MAGDWIKMRTNLQSHPKVVRILSATASDKFRVIGGLHAVWAVFDAHSEDGELKGYTPDLLDHIIGWEGFSRAMESVSWLAFDGLETITLPEFTEHNGQSAKRRAEDQKRKKDARNEGKKRPQSVRTLSADDSDEMRTREEKRREEKDQKHTATQLPTASPSTPADAPFGEAKAERLRQVTDEAIEAYNAILAKPKGLLPAVSAVGRHKRQAQVIRCLRTAREICTEQFGSPAVVPEFWAAYFAACAADEFHSGRRSGGKDHPNWKPGFEYLTREATVLEIYDREASEGAP